MTWMNRLGPPDFAFAALLLLTVLTVLVLKRRRGSGGRRLLAVGLFGGYLTVLTLIILCPLPGSPPEPAFVGDAPTPVLQISTELDLRGLLSGGLNDQNLQNLLLTVPFGFGLPFLVRRGALWLTAACLLLGAGLEGSQAVACWAAGWAYRSIDVNDLISNDLGALLGLLLFALVNWWFSLRPGPSGRTAAIGAPIAIGLVAVAVTAGPRPGFDPGIRYCEVIPASTADIDDYVVFEDHGVICLTSSHGFLVLFPGDQTPSVETSERGTLNVVGLAPASTVRAQAVLGNGSPVPAGLLQVDGVADWLVYVAPMGKAGTDDLAAEVSLFAADGSLVAEVSTQ
nr:VanZ family protein [Kineosporia mesophila]